jgi:hypothetical protein
MALAGLSGGSHQLNAPRQSPVEPEEAMIDRGHAAAASSRRLSATRSPLHSQRSASARAAPRALKRRSPPIATPSWKEPAIACHSPGPRPCKISALHTGRGPVRAGTARLEEAVAAYRAAPEEWTRARVPLDWATSTGNQGEALRLLAERRGDLRRGRTGAGSDHSRL